MKAKMWYEGGIWKLDMVGNSPPCTGTPAYLLHVLRYWIKGEVERLANPVNRTPEDFLRPNE